MKFSKAETRTVKKHITSYLVLELLSSSSESKFNNIMKE